MPPISAGFANHASEAFAPRVLAGGRIQAPFGAAVPLRVVEAEQPAGHSRVGAWLVERELGHGGMSMVYLARHESTGARAAIKVLRGEFAREPELAQRFANEARALALMRHPNVARVHEVGKMADGRPCIVLEYLEGPTLEEHAVRGPMTVSEAVPLLLQVCDGLAAAHAKGVVHRDVKAENVVLTRLADGSEQVKIIDFGAAVFAAEAGCTQPGFIIGTPQYMSPEHAQGARVDARADVYAVGVLAHRLLAGALPFNGRSALEIISKHVHEAPPPLANVPAGLAAVIRAAMAKQPEDRPAHAGLLAEALRACMSGAPVSKSPGCTARKLAPLPAMDVRLELERLRRRASGGHYEFLGIERDASAEEIGVALGTMERRLDKIDPALDGALAVVAAGLRQRLASARQTLGDPHSRAWHDALLGNFRGIARCLAAGLTSERLESMNRTWSERCPERASKAQSLAGVAEIHLRGQDHIRALDYLQRALEVAPLSADLHRRYLALKDEVAQELPRAGRLAHGDLAPLHDRRDADPVRLAVSL